MLIPRTLIFITSKRINVAITVNLVWTHSSRSRKLCCDLQSNTPLEYPCLNSELEVLLPFPLTFEATREASLRHALNPALYMSQKTLALSHYSHDHIQLGKVFLKQHRLLLVPPKPEQ